MPRLHPRPRAGGQPLRQQGRRRHHHAVQHNGGAAHRRLRQERGHGGQLRGGHLAHEREHIALVLPGPKHGVPHHRNLAFPPLIVYTRTPTGHYHRLLPGQQTNNHCRRGGVPDPQIAGHEQVRTIVDLFIGDSLSDVNSRHQFGLGHGVLNINAAAGTTHPLLESNHIHILIMVEGNVHHPNPNAGLVGNRINAAATSLNVGRHLDRYFLRVRGHLFRGDPMIAGEYYHARLGELFRRHLVLAGSKPHT